MVFVEDDDRGLSGEKTFACCVCVLCGEEFAVECAKRVAVASEEATIAGLCRNEVLMYVLSSYSILSYSGSKMCFGKREGAVGGERRTQKVVGGGGNRERDGWAAAEETRREGKWRFESTLPAICRAVRAASVR